MASARSRSRSPRARRLRAADNEELPKRCGNLAAVHLGHRLVALADAGKPVPARDPIAAVAAHLKPWPRANVAESTGKTYIGDQEAGVENLERMETDAKTVRDAATRAVIRSIVEREAAGALTGVLLFGSRARRDARPDSDWDVAAMVKDDADVIDLQKRLVRAMTRDHRIWNELVQPVVLRPQDLPAAFSLVANLQAEAVAL